MLSEVATESADGHFDSRGPQASGPAAYPHIPAGDYEATVINAVHRVFHFGSKHGIRKAVVSFRIKGDPRIARPEGVVVDFIKQARGGRSCDLRRAWVVAVGHQPRRDDELPLDVFRSHRFVIRVVDVATDSRGIPLARVNWYSKVAAVLGKIA
jgi:hypothetical protein